MVLGSLLHSGVNIPQIKSSVKVPGINIDGVFVPMGGIFLDLVTKILVSDTSSMQNAFISQEQDRVKIVIEHIIVFDGQSLRRLDLDEVRTPSTLHNRGKASIKNSQDSTGVKVISELTDAGLKVTGNSVMTPIYKLGKILIKRLGVFSNSSSSVPFKAKLVVGAEQIGTLKTLNHKWNSYKLQGDEDKFQMENEYLLRKPVIRSQSELMVGNTNGNILAARLNIPIFGLSRDHAGDALITSETIVSVIDKTRCKTQIASQWSQINLGSISYETLLEADIS